MSKFYETLGARDSVAVDKVPDNMVNTVGISDARFHSDIAVWLGTFGESGTWLPITKEQAVYVATSLLRAVGVNFTLGSKKKYLFNVMTSIEVEAEDEQGAYDMLNDGSGETIDRDIMLVEVED